MCKICQIGKVLNNDYYNRKVHNINLIKTERVRQVIEKLLPNWNILVSQDRKN